MAVAHAGGKEALLWELLRRYPPNPNLSHGFPYVLRTGRPDLVPEVTPEVLKEVAVDAENLRLLQALNLERRQADEKLKLLAEAKEALAEQFQNLANRKGEIRFGVARQRDGVVDRGEHDGSAD